MINLDQTIDSKQTLRLGFDHEHSRSDRDENIQVMFNNTKSGDQFQISSRRQETDLEAPYDFHSIIHYTSYQAAKNGFNVDPVLVSKLPVLISNTNEIEFSRDFLSPIDIYKIQRFYGCPTIPMPRIVNQTEKDVLGPKFERIVKRFALETAFKGVNEDVMVKWDGISNSLLKKNKKKIWNYRLSTFDLKKISKQDNSNLWHGPLLASELPARR